MRSNMKTNLWIIEVRETQILYLFQWIKSVQDDKYFSKYLPLGEILSTSLLYRLNDCPFEVETTSLAFHYIHASKYEISKK